MTPTNDSSTRPDSPLCAEVLPPRRPGRAVATLAVASAGGAAVAVGVLGALLIGAAPAALTIAIAVEPAQGTATDAAPVVAVAIAPTEIPAQLPPAPAPELFGLVTRGNTWLVLEGRANRAWVATQPVVTYASADSMWVERAVKLDPATTPERLAGWAGRHIVVVDADGNRCAATVGDVTGRQFGYNEQTPKVGDVINENYFSTAVVAPLHIASGCGAPQYALSSDGSARHGHRSDASAALAKRARKAFRATSPYKRIQRSWIGYEGTGQWDVADGINEVHHLRLGADEFVLVSAYGGACGGPEGQLVAMWRVNDGALGEMVMPATELSLTNIEAVLDLDGDHLPDLVIGQDLATATLRSAGGEYTVDEGISIDHDFCRC